MTNRTDGDVVLAEHVAVKGDLQMAIPDGLGDEEAAALGGPLSVVVRLSFFFSPLPAQAPPLLFVFSSAP